MAKTVRYLDQVAARLERNYGSARAQAIMAKALTYYDELLAENADELARIRIAAAIEEKPGKAA